MLWRVLSVLVSLLGLVAAYLQLNDPDPARWFALYFAAAVVAALHAADRPLRYLSGVLAATCLVWALAIVPQLLGRWTLQDLGASMSTERPEVELGRELGGLTIVCLYCLSATVLEQRRARVTKSPA